MFPATLAIDDPGVNDEFTAPLFTYAPNPDGSNEYDFRFAWQKTITADLSFSIGDTFTHLTNTVKPDGTIGTLNGWHNIETQLKYQLYVNPEHEFIVSVAGSVEWGHTGDVGIGFADPFSSITAKAFVGKGFGDVEAEWLRPIAVTGEIAYTWSTHPNDFLFDPIADTPAGHSDAHGTHVWCDAAIQLALYERQRPRGAGVLQKRHSDLRSRFRDSSVEYWPLGPWSDPWNARNHGYLWACGLLPRQAWTYCV